MVNIETELREEFHRVDDIAQMPPGAIDRALRTAGRQRRRRRVGVAMGAAAVAVGLVVPTVALRQSGQPAAARPRPAQLIGVYGVFSGNSSYTQRVLDPATGKYVATPKVDGVRADDIEFSPDGRNVIFRPNTYDHRYSLESTADFAAGRVSKAVRITPTVGAGTMAGSAQWSADGKRILLPYYKGNGKQAAGFSIYDVASRRTGRLVTLPSVDHFLIWGRSSREIAGSDDALKGAPADTVRFYSLAGKLRSQVTISAGKNPDVAKLGPFSPNGRYVALANNRVYDLQRGRQVPQPTLPHCSTPTARNPIGWSSGSTYLLACTTKPAVFVVGVDGNVRRTIELPLGSPLMPDATGGKAGTLTDVTIAGAAGYPGGGGIRF